MCDPVDVPVPAGRLARRDARLPGQYTYVRKPVALIEYSTDPPRAVQRLAEPARLLEMIGALVKPHPDKSMSR